MRKLSAEDRALVSTTRDSGVGGEHWVELCFRYEAALAATEEGLREVWAHLYDAEEGS